LLSLASLFTLLLNATAIADSTSIPFTYQKRVPFVQVQPTGGNQTPMCFILDTASSPTVIESMAAGHSSGFGSGADWIMRPQVPFKDSGPHAEAFP